MTFFLTFLSAMAGGFVQAVTGFGGGIVMMTFLPWFLPLLQGAAVSSAISIAGQISMVTRYHKHCHIREVIKPSLIYMIACGVALYVAPDLAVEGLKAVFGLFLIALAIYFIFFSGKFTIRGGNTSAVVCSSLSGAASGFFGIGGPPMVVYYLARFGDDKYAYLATLQLFFLVTGIYSTVGRLMNGILTLDLVWYIFAGIGGILVGNFLGSKVVQKINVQMMKKCIYIFLAAVGVLTFLQNI